MTYIESKTSQMEYQEWACFSRNTLESLRNPNMTWSSIIQHCIEKCREHADSKESYEQLSSLHLDCAELGIDCDSAALILYERHIQEEFG